MSEAEEEQPPPVINEDITLPLTSDDDSDSRPRPRPKSSSKVVLKKRVPTSSSEDEDNNTATTTTTTTTAPVTPNKRIRIAVTSLNEYKLDAVRTYFDNDLYEIKGFQIDDPKQCPQPMNDYGIVVAKGRIKWLIENLGDQEPTFDYYISLENYIKCEQNLSRIQNITKAREALVGVLYAAHQETYYTHKMTEFSGNSIFLEIELFKTLLQKYRHPHGATTTYGLLYHEKHPDVPANNWMFYTKKIHRFNMLVEMTQHLYKGYEKNCLPLDTMRQRLISYPDQQLTTDCSALYHESKHLNFILKKIKQMLKTSVTLKFYIFGLESAVLAMPIALALDYPFVQIRATKTPPTTTPTSSSTTSSTTTSSSFSTTPTQSQVLTESFFDITDQSQTTLTLNNNSLPPGYVLILDEVLTDGNRLAAANKLVKKAGHKVLYCITLTDVPSLRDQAKKNLLEHKVLVVLRK